MNANKNTELASVLALLRPTKPVLPTLTKAQLTGMAAVIGAAGRAKAPLTGTTALMATSAHAKVQLMGAQPSAAFVKTVAAPVAPSLKAPHAAADAQRLHTKITAAAAELFRAHTTHLAQAAQHWGDDLATLAAASPSEAGRALMLARDIRAGMTLSEAEDVNRGYTLGEAVAILDAPAAQDLDTARLADSYLQGTILAALQSGHTLTHREIASRHLEAQAQAHAQATELAAPALEAAPRLSTAPVQPDALLSPPTGIVVAGALPDRAPPAAPAVA